MQNQHANRLMPAYVSIAIMVAIVSLGRTSPAMRPAERERPQPSSPAARPLQSATPPNPAELLAAAQVLYVNSRTGFIKSEVIESELLKRTGFQQRGMVLTKTLTKADLIMEVRRSNFTTVYPYVVFDAKSQFIVASGKVNSLFGSAAAKIAKSFIKQLQKARSSAASPSKKN